MREDQGVLAFAHKINQKMPNRVISCAYQLRCQGKHANLVLH